MVPVVLFIGSSVAGSSDRSLRGAEVRLETFSVGDCVVQVQDGAYATPANVCSPGNYVKPGQVCEFHKKAGYSCQNLGDVVCDKNGTSWWNGDEYWSPLCMPNPCKGGPVGKRDPNANYERCTEYGYTGQKCNPTCKEGTHLSSPGYFELLCDHNNQYDVAGALERYEQRRICVPDMCLRGPMPGTADPKADYSMCSPKSSGDRCEPDCKQGFHPSGSFTLRCNQNAINGGYNASGAWCDPNHCAGGPYTSVDHKADYSSCDKMRTGDMCKPTCAHGYGGSGEAGFSLTCLSRGSSTWEEGVYSAHGFSCSPKQCKGGPVKGTASQHADFDDCNAKHTGDTCRPKCPVGYQAEGEFVLICDDGSNSGWNTYNASSARCVPSPCMGGPSAGKSSHANYSRCDNSHTGDVCEPECDLGYVAVGKVELVCVHGRYDASGASCVAGQCSLGPVVKHDQAHLMARATGQAGTKAPDWARCNRKHTGDKCNPQCPAGFTALGGVFDLVCVDEHYSIPPGILCERSCDRGPLPGTADSHADYDSCNALASGDKCTPLCAPGWTVSGGFKLVCSLKAGESDGDGGWYDASNVQCDANQCSGGPRKKYKDPIANYGNCNHKRSGEKCTPECPEGYSPDGDITLVCEKSDENATSNTYTARGMTCVPNECKLGPTSHNDPSADYRACSKLRSGDICAPGCQKGYHSHGNFTLVCEFDSYDAAGAVCTENTCLPGTGQFPGYKFLVDGCTSVSSCKGGTGMSCTPGHVAALPEEGGIQLLCPVNGGEFVPTGCSEVECPHGATRCTGSCACDRSLGFEGQLEWKGNRYEGTCKQVAGYQPAECSTFWLWMTIVLLIVALLLMCYFFLISPQMAKREKPEQDAPRSLTGSNRGGSRYGATDRAASATPARSSPAPRQLRETPPPAPTQTGEWSY